jgi:hypothetical protein
MQNANHAISLVKRYIKISIYLQKKGVWNDLDEKQLQHKIVKGPYKSPPNSYQIGNLDGNILT